MSDDDEKIERLKPLPFLRAAGKARVEEDVLWPGFNEPYRAAGSPENDEITRLVIVLGKDGFKDEATAYHIFQYVHLDECEVGFTASGEQWFSFLFSGRSPKLVTVHGRNLLRICEYISLRRMPWIRLADRDFRRADGVPDEEPIITSIKIADWKREE
jgi:hypothetical protein